VLYRYQTHLHLIHSRALRELAKLRRHHPRNPAQPNESKKSIPSNKTTASEPSQDPAAGAGKPAHTETPCEPPQAEPAIQPAAALPNPYRHEAYPTKTLVESGLLT
jgi:hypothetical protein